jgi:hypothetical protein
MVPKREPGHRRENRTSYRAVAYEVLQTTLNEYPMVWHFSIREKR